MVRVGYAESTRPLMDAVMPVYWEEIAAGTIETQVGHTVGLLEDLRMGRVDAILVPGEPAGEEEWWKSPVALEQLALVANPDNPLTGLTLQQVRAVFQGQVSTWDDMGWTAAKIEVVTREEGSAMWDLFDENVMQGRRVTLTAVVKPDTVATLDHVALHPWAIGYVPAASLDDRVNLLAVDGQYPSPETLAEQRYPLLYPVYLVAPQEPVGPLRTFVTWLLSRDGQAVIGRRYGRVR